MILLILQFLDTNWLITTAINGEVFKAHNHHLWSVLMSKISLKNI